MECSLSGASKTQVIREFKNRYELDEKDIEYLLDCCSFKKKPKNINYSEFYKNKLTTECEKFKYPITQIYKYENFLTDSDPQTEDTSVETINPKDFLAIDTKLIIKKL